MYCFSFCISHQVKLSPTLDFSVEGQTKGMARISEALGLEGGSGCTVCWRYAAIKDYLTHKYLHIEIKCIGIVSNEHVIASFAACSIFWHEFCVCMLNTMCTLHPCHHNKNASM